MDTQRRKACSPKNAMLATRNATRITPTKMSANLTMDMLHDMNAKHAKEHANATKAETVALHKKSAAAAAALLRGFSDADLAKSGVVLTGMPPMSGEQIVHGILFNHIDEHLKSIRATIGK